MRLCKQCGADISHKKINAIYCSVKCRVNSNNAQKRNNMNELNIEENEKTINLELEDKINMIIDENSRLKKRLKKVEKELNIIKFNTVIDVEDLKTALDFCREMTQGEQVLTNISSEKIDLISYNISRITSTLKQQGIDIPIREERIKETGRKLYDFEIESDERYDKLEEQGNKDYFLLGEPLISDLDFTGYTKLVKNKEKGK